MTRWSCRIVALGAAALLWMSGPALALGDGPLNFSARSLKYASLVPHDSAPFTRAGLTEGVDGALYGVTSIGGAHGFGRIFRFTADGQKETVHSFAGGVQGEALETTMLRAGDGFFYGVALGVAEPGRCMVFFRAGVDGSYTVLGELPQENCSTYEPLVEASDGNFYGTGIDEASSPAAATVFRVSRDGVFATLHRFVGGPNDGDVPNDALVEAADGHLWGVASGGGLHNHGVVYRISLGGSFTVMHSFEDRDCSLPNGLAAGSDGALWSTCLFQNFGVGSLFRITLDGQFSVLHKFGGRQGDFPSHALLAASDGYLYGTTYNGAANGWGSIFRIDMTGNVENVRMIRFDEGWEATEAFMQAGNGRIYGLMTQGGRWGAGSLVSFGPPLAPQAGR